MVEQARRDQLSFRKTAGQSRRERLVAGVLVGVLLLTAGRSWAVPGDLDLSFGTDGEVATSVSPYEGSVFTAVAAQEDGKLVAAGAAFNGVLGSADFLVARYNADGSLDPDFGAGGVVTTDFSGCDDVISVVLVQADGKIVVAGRAWTTPPQLPGINEGGDFALARYNSDGSLDPSFGVGGKVTTDFSGLTDHAYALAVLDDGRLVAAGTSIESLVPGSEFRAVFAVTRYNSDGSLDTSFDGDGIATTRVGGFPDGVGEIHAILVQPDGKLVAIGSSFDPAGPGWGWSIAVVRYNTDGTLDVSFGDSGKIITDRALAPWGSWGDWGSDAVLQSDGKLAVAGYTAIPTDDRLAANWHILLLRFNLDGSPDSSFGTQGAVISRLAPRSEQATGLVLQADGKLVVTGFSVATAGLPDDPRLVLRRYNSAGGLDRSFGDGGVVQFPTNGDIPNDLALQSDGKLVAAGLSESDTGTFREKAMLWQFLNDAAHCDAQPQPDCNSATVAASLVVADNTAHTRRKVRFRWAADTFPSADFSDPTQSSDNTLCIYDQSAGVVGVRVPIRKGMRMISAHGSSAPAIHLRSGLAYPVRAQLRNSKGVCWETSFQASETKSNSATLFKAARKTR